MICVFKATDKDFASNGDKILHPTKAKVNKTDNGDYYLDLEVGLSELKYLTQDAIIAVDTPFGRQGFRVNNVDIKPKKGTTKAWHLYYDLENFVVMDTRPENATCDDALKKLVSGSDMPSNKFSVSSDITDTNTYYCVRTSLKEAIDTVLDRWGGHLVRDNYNIAIKKSIGADNGVTLAYGKNISDIQVTEKWDNVVTRIYPVGKDGLLLNVTIKNRVTSDVPYIDSDIQYDRPYNKVVSFSQDVEEDEDEEDETIYQVDLWYDLKTQATEYLKTNCVPEITYTVKSTVPKITDIGDIVNLYYTPLDINLEMSVTSLVYDAIQAQFTEVTFGNYKRKLSDFKQTVTTTVANTVMTNVVSEISKIKDESLTIAEIDELTK